MSTRLRFLALTAAALAAVLGVQKVSASPGTTPERDFAGYTVAGVQYELGPSGAVRSLGFTLSPGARKVHVRFSAQDGWRPCSVTGSRVACPVGMPLAALKRLQVEPV